MKRIFTIISVLALLASCNSGPSKVEQRKLEILQNDSTELVAAQDSLATLSDLIMQAEFAVEDMKAKFVLDKTEQYQTMGYYLLPKHASAAQKPAFFPEVDEEGKLLLVRVTRKGEVKYDFLEVATDAPSFVANDEVISFAGKLDASRLADCEACYQFAKKLTDFNRMTKDTEHLNVKIKFYENKVQKDLERLVK